MNVVGIIIEEGSIFELYRLLLEIPEFTDPKPKEYIEERLADKQYLILIAYVNGIPAGFKAGYLNNGEFYSWLGGVLPAYRRLGIAKTLAEEQEKRLRQQGIRAVTFKTHNKHRNMLLFSISNGFQIVGFEPRTNLEDHRIYLWKKL